MTKRVVGSGIANNYVSGELVRKIFVLYIPKNPPTEPPDDSIEVESRDVEKYRRECPRHLIPCTFFFFDELSMKIKVDGIETELRDDFFNTSEEYEVS